MWYWTNASSVVESTVCGNLIHIQCIQLSLHIVNTSCTSLVHNGSCQNIRVFKISDMTDSARSGRSK